MSQPPLGPMGTFNVPTLQPPNLGPQSNGFQMTTAAAPGQPDFTTYFGKPLREIKTNPYEAYARENYALPEAYMGSNPFITRILIQLITEDDMWVTRRALPFRFTEGEMEVAWSVWIFNNHGMDNVPEEGVSRLLSSEMQERRGSYVRYGLAFILEHGFMKTPRGQLCYQMNLMQIRNAILETLYYEAIEAYLLCKEYNNVWNARHGAKLTLSAARDIMRAEVENWACIQKSDGGWDLLDSRCKRTLQDAGHSPNMWILPRGMKPYIALDRNNTSYFLKGPEGQALYKSALNGQNVNQVDVSNSCEIYESKAFQMPERNEPLDLLWRERSCGEYYLMVNHLPGYPLVDYKSCWRDTVVYNEARDQFNPITLRTALENCGRFDADGGLVDDGGYDARSDQPDLFYYKKNDTEQVHLCRFFGDMTAENLSKETIRSVAETLLRPLEKTIPDFVKRYERGLELIQELENGDLSEAYVTKLADTVEKENFHPTTKMPMLPDVKEVSYVPVGFASWPGLQTLAMEQYADGKYGIKTYHERAKDFVALISSMYFHLSRTLFNSMFLDHQQQSPYFEIPDGRTTFFENLISVPRPCVYVNTGVTGSKVPSFRVNFFHGTNGTTNPNAFFLKQLLPTVTTFGPGINALDGKKDLTAGEIAAFIIEQTFETVDGLKDKAEMAKQRLTRAFTAMEIPAIMKTAAQDNGLKELVMAIVGIFKLIEKSEDATLASQQMSKFIGTIVGFDSVFKLEAFITEYKTAIEAEPATVNDSIPVEVFSKAVIGKLEDAIAAANAVDVATKRTIIPDANAKWVRVPLVASKRMIQQMQKLDKIKPSMFLNGMAPVDDASISSGSDGYTSLPKYEVAMKLIRARVGDDHELYTAAHLTMHTRDEEMPAMVGAKRGRRGGGNGRDEDESRSKARFGARAAGYSTGLTDDEDRYFNAGGSGGDRNPNVIGGGIFRMFNNNFEKRFNESNLAGDNLLRVMTQSFLGTTIHKQALLRFIDNDVFFPIGFLVTRPFITHLMGTAILTTAGAEVGETLVGHADFQLSDNVIQKMHYGNFTFYAKSLVYYPEKVLIVTDIISKRYIMGNDMTFFDKRSLDSFMSGQNGSEHKRSILVFAVPADQRREGMYEYDNPLDLTGKYADHLEMLGAQNNNGQRLMFSSAGWYGAHYNMQNNQHSNQDRDYFGYFPRAQSLCYQGMQWLWAPGSSSHSMPVQGTGHWGYRVYEGCASVRSGSQSKLLRECNYSMYGGMGAVPSVALGY